MPKFTFICEHLDLQNKRIDSKITTEVFTEHIDDVLTYIDCFLKGAGYVFDGKVEIVPPDDGWVGQPDEPANSGDVEDLSTKSSHYFDTERNR